MTNAQLSLTDAQAAANEAIARVEANADPGWMTLAYQTVCSLAETHDTLTTDEIWAALPRDGRGTHDPRALGPVMRRAAHDRLIRATASYVPSRRPGCHARPVRVWLSLRRP